VSLVAVGGTVLCAVQWNWRCLVDGWSAVRARRRLPVRVRSG